MVRRQGVRKLRVYTVVMLYIDIMRNARKGPLCNMRETQARSAGDNGLRCPLTESMDNVVYVDEQRRPWSDCADAQSDLGLRCSHMA